VDFVSNHSCLIRIVRLHSYQKAENPSKIETDPRTKFSECFEFFGGIESDQQKSTFLEKKIFNKKHKSILLSATNLSVMVFNQTTLPQSVAKLRQAAQQNFQSINIK